MARIPYTVGSFRSAGLLAKWTKQRGGAPIIAVRRQDSQPWYVVDRGMHKTMESVGILEGFEQHTALGDIFSIKV